VPTCHLAGQPCAGGSLSDNVDQRHWWTVLEAIAWIVARSDEAVADAGLAAKTFNDLRSQELRPASGGEAPPVSLEAAPFDLMRAAEAKRVSIWGRYCGTEALNRLKIDGDHVISDFADKMAIVDLKDFHERKWWDAVYWSDLVLDAREVQAFWPAPPKAKIQPCPVARITRDAAAEGATPLPSSQAIEIWISDTRDALITQGSKHGRDKLVRLAAEHFQVPQKVPLDVWKTRGLGRRKAK
jgi:hypothetical protein